MPPASRVTDIGSGHGSFPDTDVIQGSPNVIVVGKPQHRVGDAVRDHGSHSPSPSHGRKCKAGSPTVLTNSKQSARIGDPVHCGGNYISGAPTVIMGG